MKRLDDQTGFSLFSFLIHLLVLLQFYLNPVPREIYRDFFWQFYLLLGLSLIGSVIISFVKKSRPYILLFRLLIILLISYPTGHYIWIGALLMITLTVETALYTPLPWGRVLSIVCIIPLYFFQKERSAFYTPVAGASLPDIILLGWLPLLSGQAAIIYHKKIVKNRELENLNKRLDLAATRLIDANLGYQNYAKQLESRTLNEERRRISREIHDSVG
jgi:signal transduction histidine kinase